MSHEFYPHNIDQNATTETVKKKTMAFNISPEARATVQLGFLFTCAVAISMATIFVWNIKSNVEMACEEIKLIRADMATNSKRLDRLWWEYEQRTGKRDEK